jgi:phosphohistidine phosphatase
VCQDYLAGPPICQTRPVRERQLILIRHAKAEAGTDDRLRALTPRGQADATAVGRLLARADLRPDRAVVSPAVRARQTWDRVQAGLLAPVELLIDSDIYRNEVGLLLELAQQLPAELGCVVLVGHNPAMAEFGHLLDDGAGDPAARAGLLAGYPTSGVAIFDVTDGWDALTPRSATLRSFAVGRG